MEAIIWTKYGPPDGLQLRELEKPTSKDNEVLIRVKASTVTAGDVETRSLNMPLWLAIPIRIFAGLTRPKRIPILGQELAGEVEAVGKDVKRFKPGDRVFGSTGFGFGGYAEYKCQKADSDDAVLAIIPEGVSYEEAAAIPTGALEALHFLRKADIQPGEQLLVNGAGGSIGTFGVQLAKYFGAEVTGVDSAEKLDLVRSLGADHVIDYAEEDFSQGEKKYDVILDVVGKDSFDRCIQALKPNGRYLMANPKPSLMMRGARISRNSDKQVISENAKRSAADLDYLVELVVEGKLKVVIDRMFPLEETAEAHRYVETGKKKGNVVITIS
jgi:NADPH:quinone reductase-like Zn-dependent oxidoreductase